MSETRKIAAILAADVVGYSRLAGADEDRTLARLRALRSDLIDPTIAVHHGRVVKRTGDGALVEFRSVVDAVRCAIEVQNGMVERNAGVPPERRIEFRIGIHLGDIVEESDGDLMGDGINIAARLEGIAKPGTICLSEDAYRQVKARLNLAVSDLGATQLKNIAEPIRVYLLEVGAAVQAKPTTPSEPAELEKPSAPLALPSKPSIAVLAFQNMSGDPEQEYFADGIAEDIITALSRLRWLFVIARNSSFTYKSKSVDVRQVGRELGVRYVLEGSVRKTGNRVRINAQLIDASDGHHVWADRYDRALEDIFAVQDEMTNQITSAIAPGIVAAEVQRAQEKDADELSTWERLMQAHWHIQRFSPEDFRKAIRLLDELLRHDPNNATALSDLAFALHFSGSFAWADDPAAAFARSGEIARRAIASDDKDAAAHAMAAIDELFSGRHDDAIRRLRRAIELDPNSSIVHGELGAAYAFGGEADLAIQQAQTAIRLSPRDFLNVIWHTTGAWAHLSAERFEEAAECARRAIDSNPAFADAHGVLAAASAYLGRTPDARASLDAFTRLVPGNLANQLAARPFRRPVDRERYVAGLHKAGLPAN
jgi:TolB-like protein/class 3 adenylate cyclase/Flp pilus assembly protein TadD